MSDAEQAQDDQQPDIPVVKEKSWLDKRLDRAFKGGVRWVAKKVYGAKIEGLEHFAALKGKPYVITPNHISMLDAILLTAALPVEPAIAIDQDQYNKFMSHWWSRPFMKRVNLFPLNAQNPYAIKHLTRLAQSGTPILIYPEGRLTRTGTLGKVFDGAALIAANAGVPIVPVYVEGLQRLPFGSATSITYPRRLRPQIRVMVNPPRLLEIPADLAGKEKRSARRRELQKAMQEMPVRALDKNKTLIGALHEAAANYGTGRKILDDAMNRKLTYNRVLGGAYALGEKLAAITEKGENVGLILPNSAGAVMSLFGLNAYGRVAAFINPKSKLPELTANCETIAMNTLVTSRTMLENMAEADRKPLEENLAALSEKYKIVYLEDIKADIGAVDKFRAGLIAKGLAAKPADAGTGGDPAIIIFTSGSEGPPKGVVHSSTSLLSNVEQLHAVTPIQPSDKVFNAMPVFHSFGMMGGILMPLLNGLPSFQFPSPLASKIIPGVIYDYDATIMFGSDSFLANYAHYADDEDFMNIDMIFAGGEALQDSTVKTYFERFGKPIYQGYGRSEQGPVVAISGPGFNRPGTMGRLLPLMEAKWEPMPGYDKGQRLFLRGPNTMLGYMMNDKPGVIQALPGGWDDTGDIISMTKEGNLIFEERAKRLAKIGAEYVPLSRIEKMAAAASLRPKAEHGAVEGVNKIILFTTDPDLRNSALGQAAKKLNLETLGMPKNPDIHYMKELPHLGIGKINYPALKKIFNAMSAGEPPAAGAETAAEDTYQQGPPAGSIGPQPGVS
jgi:acyl-[acyl-carrier-protein]-phospholipid O-acyltransferase / long-chain-fatty-acid--[acyl-carrier-protein] ligase